MVIDITSQQQLSEVFSTNHHRSSSSSSTQKRSTTTNPTMTNGSAYLSNDLGKKAEQILGHAPAVVDYCRQPSLDYSNLNPSRINISEPKSRVNQQQIIHPINRHSVSIEQLVPLILKLVAPLRFTKLSQISKHINHAIESHDTDLKLSDDENDEIPSENPNKSKPSNSDMENDDETQQTNRDTVSLADFVPAKHSPGDFSKRPSSPSTPVKQPKRKELIRSFSSSVNIPIDINQPTLPITIPTYLFLDQSTKTTTTDDQPKTSKRFNSDTNDYSNTITTTKRSKTSHSPAFIIKEEPQMVVSHHELPFAGNMATIAPMLVQQKKEKPTANVKPLLQSMSIDNLSSINTNSNVSIPLTTTTNTSIKTNYTNLRHLSIKELNSLAREKKKQADAEKRSFEDVKQSMALYLESVCYFIRCANDEPILEQRRTLLTATIAMLQHLAYNYQKIFHISGNQSIEAINHIRPKFLLINYWLQSLIYQLQYNTNVPLIERCAPQVTEYFNHTKSPADNTTNLNYIYDFAKYMLNSYHSNYYWNKAERLTREEPSKKFLEQLLRHNQNRRLSRDDSTIDFLLYIFDAIDILRLTVN